MEFKTSTINLPFLTEERPEIINKFLSYCRNRGKTIINLDKIKYCKKYREVFGKIYMVKMISESSRFVAYQSGVALYTDVSELFPWQIRHEKFFGSYFKVLTENLKDCKFCSILGYKQTKKIVVICQNCHVEVCQDCYEEVSSTFFRYNNQFRCLICRELNFWE
jgi:hypothetical protein